MCLSRTYSTAHSATHTTWNAMIVVIRVYVIFIHFVCLSTFSTHLTPLLTVFHVGGHLIQITIIVIINEPLWQIKILIIILSISGRPSVSLRHHFLNKRKTISIKSIYIHMNIYIYCSIWLVIDFSYCV